MKPTRKTVSACSLIFKKKRSIVSGAIALSAILLSGCSSPRLEIVTVPAGAQITVRNTKNKNVISGVAPLEVPVNFSSANQTYTVDVKPPSNLTERYSGATTNLTRQLFSLLPQQENESHRRLNLKLDEKLFLVVPYLEVILDSRQSWRGVVMWSRAYKDVSEAGGSVPTKIAEFGDNIGVQSLALSPDGTRIVYSVAGYVVPPADLWKLPSANTLQTVDVAGANLNGISINAGGIEHITSENFRDMFPSFTSDGQYLLFASNRRRANSEDILRISALHRGGISDIYVHRDGRLMQPTESKDGTIAFCIEDPHALDPKQRFTIWTLGGPNQFPTQIQIGSQPAISPDGKYIAYIGADGNLWEVRTDGSQATQLTFGADRILERYKASLAQDELAHYEAFLSNFGFAEKTPFSYPAWSADGSGIVYTAMEGSDSTGRPNEDIWFMNFDGSNKQQLTTNGSIDRYPLLSPDRKWVYFMSNRGGRWAIWRIAAPAK
jgi:hypothetical protein